MRTLYGAPWVGMKLPSILQLCVLFGAELNLV